MDYLLKWLRKLQPGYVIKDEDMSRINRIITGLESQQKWGAK